MSRSFHIALLTFAAVGLTAATASAQGQWWERPQAPPEADAEAGAEQDPGDEQEAEGPGQPAIPTAAPPAAAGAPPEVLDPDNFDNPEGQDLGDITATPVLGGLDSSWRWQQVLSSPRIGSRLTAVTIDPRNPNRIFVGTEEGTILRSQDGGVTWRELEMDPIVTSRRSFAIRSPGLPELGAVVRGGLTLIALPPGQTRPVSIATVPGAPLPQYWTLSANFAGSRYIRAFILNRPGAGVTLLRDAVEGRRTTPVNQIAICTGGTYPLMVASRNEVLGSTDGGLTYVRSLRLPGNIGVRRIVCSRTDPNQVMVATDFGMYRSTNGGVTFDPDLTSRPGNPARDVAFGPGPEGPENAYVGSASRVYAGDPDSEVGIEMVYPDFNNSSTAPWENVNWIETTADGHVWVATSDGVRASFDMGHNWETIGRTLLSRQVSTQITVGVNERGGRRVAVLVKDCPNGRCRSSLVYASDDNGQTWFPFFQGATRRNLQQMAAAPGAPGLPPRWWVVTGGELWATMPGGMQLTPDVDTESQRWARHELRDTPDMRLVIEETLNALQLNRDQIDGMFSAIRWRNLVPSLQVQGWYTRRSFNRLEDETMSGAITTRWVENWNRNDFRVNGWLSWRLGSTAYTVRELAPTRNRLYELRRQVAFIAEDAWHERALLLQRIARGMSDRLQVEILKERITVLETVLEVWLRRPLSTLPSGRMRIEEIQQ